MGEEMFFDSKEFPKIGIGTWRITDLDTLRVIIGTSYDIGYRLLDTAAVYSNEVAIGKVIGELNIPRSELVITDKVWTNYMGYEKVKKACKKSMRKLNVDYIDCYLIHWPASPVLHPDWKERNADTWAGMEDLVKEGLVRRIGISNFKKHQIEILNRTARIKPFLNQIEFHPGLPQTELISYCKKEGIIVQASSPLGNGQIFTNGLLLEIADKYNCTVPQICISWALQRGVSVIPKTTRPARLLENWKALGFTLCTEDIELINQIPFCGGFNLDSDEVTEFG